VLFEGLKRRQRFHEFHAIGTCGGSPMMWIHAITRETDG
jgi:hypothetical protein